MRMQCHGAVVVERIAFPIYLLRIRRNRIGRDGAHDLECAAVVIDRVSAIDWSIICVAVLGVQLLDVRDLGQFDVLEQELDVLVVEEEVPHGSLPILFCVSK